MLRDARINIQSWNKCAFSFDEKCSGSWVTWRVQLLLAVFCYVNLCVRTCCYNTRSLSLYRCFGFLSLKSLDVFRFQHSVQQFNFNLILIASPLGSWDPNPLSREHFSMRQWRGLVIGTNKELKIGTRSSYQISFVSYPQTCSSMGKFSKDRSMKHGPKCLNEFNLKSSFFTFDM